MTGHDLPRLDIPSTPPLQGQSPGHTGRPTTWTPSALRKLARVYVYSDLSLEDATRVVHHYMSTAIPPRVDSANKKLKTMLDTQPRWLRPNAVNMGERLLELANSPRAATAPSTKGRGRSRAVSDLGPHPFGAADFELDMSSSPSPLKLSPHSAATPVFAGPPFDSSPTIDDGSPDMSYQEFCAQTEAQDNERDLNEFVRRTTFMSTGTDKGSLQAILPNKSPIYKQALRRVVKRFTISDNDNLGDPANISNIWPDDTISCSILANQSSPLPGLLARIENSYDDRTPSPWFNYGSPTAALHSILAQGPSNEDLNARDTTGNTILHALASNPALITPQVLFQHIVSNRYDRIINVRNTAGQTCVHLLNVSYWNQVDLYQLLSQLAVRGFNILAKDIYGRTVFHTFLSNGASPQVVGTLLCDFATPEAVARCNTRDAFGNTPLSLGTPIDFNVEDPLSLLSPHSNPASPLAYPSPGRLVDSIMLENVRKAHENPHLEFEGGRNGLHCLAAAKMSLRSVVANQGGLSRSGSERSTRRGDRTPEHQLDSSSERLQARLNAVRSLLQAGVDPNHYDHAGNTPLMAFAAELPEDDDYKKGPEILALLVQNGANVNARNRAGETALHVAVRCGRKLAVRALVNNRANVHARDGEGRSMLDVADAKIRMARLNDAKTYAHLEACRAWLSGNGAVQSPSLLQEWGVQ